MSVTEKTNELVHPRKIKTTGGCILKVREIIKIIKADGWYIVTTNGSHRQYKHPENPAGSLLPGIWQMILHPAR